MKSRTASNVHSIWLLVGALAGGCTGAIGSNGSGSSGAGTVAPGSSVPTTGSGTGNTGSGTTGSGSGTTPTSGGTTTPGNGATPTSGGTTSGTTPVASGPRDPGRVTTRRLNRAEYDNTVHDLLGTTQTLGATLFPDDAPQVGFDNNGDLQTLSPEQFALYQQAAQTLAAEAMTVGSAERSKLITCDLTTGNACSQTLITNLGLRAFRRPLTAAEVTSYSNLMTTAAGVGATTDEQFRTVIEAMLVSPNFLFRPEIDADPTSLTPHLLNPYETASRLSYMVYRSMPDQALFAAAAAGTLAQPSDVQTQLQRMLADPKGVFAQTFASQWLGTGSVDTQTFDATMFPKFNPSLANSMGNEVLSFFNEFLQKNEPVPQLMTANFSYIDSNLAALYGIPAPTGTGLVRTTLTTPQRQGLLTMAGILSVTSYPTRTSVVKRGAWVLSQLLCSAPPPPPANVPPFPTTAVTATSQKEILAEHRADPACAVCHDSMDNIGIAMENYDAMGAYRTLDNGVAIDASGKFAGAIALSGGASPATFVGAVQLGAAVGADPRFVKCVAQNAMTYSLGRDLLATDQPYLADITAAPANGGTLGVRDILMNVVASDTFRMRRGDPTTSTTMTGAKQ